MRLLIIFCLFIVCSCDTSPKGDFIRDPLRKDQWYINGSKQDENLTHINLNDGRHKGRGVLVALVDTGIDIFHEDLIDNIGEGNYSYLPEDYSFEDASHGTACAGVIAGKQGNGLGIAGIAPGSEIIGFNALKLPAISNLADALVRHKERVWVSNNSWGDFNSWGEPLALRSLMKTALEEGVRDGRDGKGTIYVFAAGNGAYERNGLPTDNVNYSGLVNNRFTIPVCAVDENGVKTSYSEIGATLVVCAPSKGEDLGITTTDLMKDKGYNPTLFPDDYSNQSYTKNFGGTSASAPIVSAVTALMLEANPDLGWRDARAVLAKSAEITDATHDDWTENGAGLEISHYYGFGLVNADIALELAKKWVNYPEETTIEKEIVVNAEIPDADDSGVTSHMDIDEDISIEFIDVFFDAPDHTKIGDLEIILTAPSGAKSVLAERHDQFFGGVFRYDNWRFGSMRHLEESSRGTWSLTVRDKAEGDTGTFKSWKLKLYGHAPMASPE